MFKKLHIPTIILAILCSLLAVNLMPSPRQTGSAASTKWSDSTYERVIKTGTIRCGYATWAPYLVKDPNTGQMSGMAYDIVEEIGRVLDLKIIWAEETGWGNFIEGLNNNRFDMMCAQVWPFGPRIRNAMALAPATYIKSYAVVRADDTRFDNNIDAINNAAIAISVIDGTAIQNEAASFPRARVIALPQMTDASQVLLDVVSKKADVTFVDLGAVSVFNASTPGALKIVESIGPTRTYPESFYVKNHEFKMKEMLDLAINILTNSGSIERIMQKYEGKISSLPPRKNYEESAD